MLHLAQNAELDNATVVETGPYHSCFVTIIFVYLMHRENNAFSPKCRIGKWA